MEGFQGYRDPSRIYEYVGLCFGCGVQSTTLLLLIHYRPELLRDTVGQLPNKAYFADTQAETKATYNHLEFLQSAGYFGDHFPLEIIPADIFQQWEKAPYFTRLGGKKGMLRRQCTNDLKIQPVKKAMRRDAKTTAPYSVGQWMGLSTDELGRMKESHRKYIEHIYPLIELGWSRQDCYQFLEQCGLVDVPKSACYFCPFRSNWREFAKKHPEEAEKACQFDEGLRNAQTFGTQGIEGELYLHQSLRPLREVLASEEAQGDLFDDDFAEECDGVCGL
jgi:hypothetical protein